MKWPPGLTKTKLDHDQKRELLTLIENKSQKECEKELVKLNPEVFQIKESIKPISRDLVEVKLVITRDLEEKLNELKNLLSHQNKSQTTQELIDILATMALKTIKKEPKVTSAANAEVHHKPLSQKETRRQVFKRDKGQCQFEDPITKRKCLSQHKIQYDHIYPKALGGGDTLENLRLLCQSHNLFKATQDFSKKHMSKFLQIQ